MGVSYAERADVYRYGVPQGALVKPARVVAFASATTDRLELEGHGFALNTPVQFSKDGDGLLPAPLVSGTVYYAIPVTDSESLFKVAATAGGAAIDLTTGGAAPFKVFAPLGPMLDAMLEVYSRWFDGKATGHLVPFTAPYPAQAKHAVAVRTAAEASRVLGLGAQAAGAFASETLLLADIPGMVRGIPMRDADATAGANLATGRSAAVPAQQGTIP